MRKTQILPLPRMPALPKDLCYRIWTCFQLQRVNWG